MTDTRPEDDGQQQPDTERSAETRRPRGAVPGVPPVPPPPPPVLPRRMPADTPRPTFPAQHIAPAPTGAAGSVGGDASEAPTPRYEPNVSAPGEDLPGAPPARRESPDRDVPESATLAGHAGGAEHPRHVAAEAADAASTPPAEGAAPARAAEPTEAAGASAAQGAGAVTAPPSGAAAPSPDVTDAPATGAEAAATSVDAGPGDGADAPTSEGGSPLAATATATASAEPTAASAATTDDDAGADPRPAPLEEWLRQQVAEARWSQPHDVLGPHPVTVARASVSSVTSRPPCGSCVRTATTSS